MSATKTCAVPGCQNSIRPAHLLCGAHWRKVPNAIQRKVYRAVQNYEASGRSALTLQNLRAKQQEAIASLMGGQPQAAAS